MEKQSHRYLVTRMKNKDIRLLVKYRYGNKTKTKDYWKESEEKKYRICRKWKKTMRYVLQVCEEDQNLKKI